MHTIGVAEKANSWDPVRREIVHAGRLPRHPGNARKSPGRRDCKQAGGYSSSCGKIPKMPENTSFLRAGQMNEPGAMAWAVVAGVIVGALAVAKLAPLVISIIEALFDGDENGES